MKKFTIGNARYDFNDNCKNKTEEYAKSKIRDDEYSRLEAMNVGDCKSFVRS